ncbi:IS30 family transposase [Sphaerisporangium sp. NPDC051017]|uniref:IS30 family transposase n=1 Tax=Sphaerisporangium sp. NPDC051017 TaxID=3154636 RepID=UPI0034454E56
MGEQRRPLTMEDREEISRCLAVGLTNKEIAAYIDRDESVVCREIARNGGRERYRAHAAQQRAEQERRRPKERKLDSDRALRGRVVSGLRVGWSPDQIAGRLTYDRCCGEAVDTVSHEAIYTWIYALPKGELARLGIELRSGRERRKPRGRRGSPGARIVGMRSIDERPAEVADRQVPGHWEGDLIIGRNGASAAATLVERKSRFTLIVPLPFGRTSEAVCDALVETVANVPGQLMKSITWDQGTEMAGHAALSLATDIDVYFAHPHSPWERGTNENTNGLIREYLPKGTKIPSDSEFLNSVSHSLNTRPRRILGYRTPAEVFVEMLSELASTA